MFRILFSYIVLFFVMEINSVAKSYEIMSERYLSNSASIIDRVMIQLLRDCFHNYGTLAVCDYHDTFLLQALFGVPFLSFIVHETGKQKIEKQTSLYKTVNAFIISTNSSEHLAKTLSSIKITAYWDIKSTFFILSNSIDGECSKASNILQTAWDKNLISAYYICSIDSEEPVIYTFNPYSSRAPKVWKLSMITTRRNNRWTLYDRKYIEGKICNDFEFNRLKYFDGANLSIVSCLSSSVPSLKLRNHGLIIAETMSQILNISFLRTEADSATKPTPNLQGFYLHLDNASAEFAVCTRSSNRRYNFSVSYPILRSGFQIISHHQGYYTPLEKISKFYGKWVLLFTFIIVFITYWVIFISEGGRKYSFATFEILRFFTNLGFLTPMDTLPKRIFFCVILIYSLILQATFQGQLSTFLTNIESRRNAETSNDLQAPQYQQVFATVPTEPFLSRIPDLKEKVKVVGAQVCAEEIVNKKFAACVNFQFFLTYHAVVHKLYLSKKFIAEDCNILLFRHDCPLKERINQFLIRLEQTGITKLWSEQIVGEDLMLLQMFKERSVINFRPIALKDVTFAFYLLIIGLTAASVVFIIEKLFNRYKQVFRFTF